MEDAVRQLSSGRKITSSADGAASLGVSQVITSQAVKAAVEARNLNDTISIYQETDGHLSGMSDLLTRMKELAVQARNQALGTQQVEAIFKEFDQLLVQYSNAQGSAAAASAQSVAPWQPPAAQNFGTLTWQAVDGAGAADNPVVCQCPLCLGAMNRAQYLASDGSVTLPGTTNGANPVTGVTIDGSFHALESTATSTINLAGTQAFIGVSLNANQYYDLSITSARNADTVLQLVDSNGSVVASGGTTGTMRVKLESGGNYYIKATSAFALGNLTFEARAFSPQLNDTTGDALVDSVMAGGSSFWRSVGSELTYEGAQISPAITGLSTNSTLATITYSFMNTASGGATATGGTYSAYPSGSALGNSASDQNGRVPFTADQQNAVRRALDYYSSILGVTFVEKTDGTGGNLNFANNTQAASGGYAYYPQSVSGSTYIYMNNTATYTAAANLEDGDYGWTALIHEIGHAMGLKHPGNYNAGGGGTDPPYLPSAMDNRAYSTMSYSNPTGWTGSEASTMGWVDIAALQYLYGAADRQNQTFTFTDADTNVLKTIFANGVGNEANFTATTLELGVDLRGGSFISIGSNRNNIGVAYGTDIETLRLGSGDATVYSDTTGVDLYLDDGDLTFTGGRGADEIILSANAATGPAVIGGNLAGYDVFYDFDSTKDSVTTGASYATAVAAFDGLDSSMTLSGGGLAVQSHSIDANGVITFSTNDVFDGGVALRSLADVAVAVEYLQGNDIGNGNQVMFTSEVDGVLNTFLFIQGQSASNGTDYMIRLVAVDGGAYVAPTTGASGVLTNSSAGRAGTGNPRIQALNTARMTAVGELQAVYDALRTAFRDSPTAIYDSVAGVDLASLVSVIERNINSVTAQRSVIGAMTNGLEAQISALGTISTNLQAANSRILDTDYAAATAELTKGQIMQQAFASVANLQSKLTGEMISTLLG
jgi:flagellin-like hook-associated protein FlgL